MMALRPLTSRMTGLLSVLLLAVLTVLAPSVRELALPAVGDVPAWAVGEICGQTPDDGGSPEGPVHDRRDCIAHCLALGLGHFLPAQQPAVVPQPALRLSRARRGLRPLRSTPSRRRSRHLARAPPFSRNERKIFQFPGDT